MAKTKKTYIDAAGGMGRGANIRIVTPDNQVVLHDPVAYRNLKPYERGALTKVICFSIGVEA